MSESEKPQRLYSRSDVRKLEISEQRESELRQAFEQTEAGETIQQCVAATFEIHGDISDSGVVVSSRLHTERIFDLVASYSGSTDENGDGVFASATVKDVDSGNQLAAHVTQDNILISRKDDDVTFQEFRDYILFLENFLHVDFNVL